MTVCLNMPTKLQGTDDDQGEAENDYCAEGYGAQPTLPHLVFHLTLGFLTSLYVQDHIGKVDTLGQGEDDGKELAGHDRNVKYRRN